MGEPETTTQDSTKTDQDNADRGARTAENIRYGQTISEGGMGGQTTTSSGQANSEGTAGASANKSEGQWLTRHNSGYGRTDDLGASDNTPAEQREASGYGGDQDHNTEVGG